MKKKALLTDERDEHHKSMGIGFEDDQYTFAGHRYAQLKYAVDYASKNPDIQPGETEKDIQKRRDDEDRERIFEQSNKVNSILLTTAPSLSNSRPYEEVEIITAECVFGMNIFRDMFAGLTDFFGGRSKASQKVLRDARKTCLSELKKEAVSAGADAVISVDLDYSEFSGQHKSMLFLVACGTAIRYLDSDN